MNRECVFWILSYSLLCFFPGAVPHTTLCHAVSGDTVILPCAIKTSEKLNISNYYIYWQIHTSVVVHLFYNGKDLLTEQSRRYHNRTRLFLDQLEHAPDNQLMEINVSPTGQNQHLPNCPGDANALDILVLWSHFLMVLVVWIL
ncbi:uncharacterized protein LOC127043040 isoform X2 [Gopherus flavomarginatus]|uniref:uncharacterized protein LOC127043040 isoform X2 n=1 Tax=Gopherus flavomarginatus TaxID=286002 RepID=UPI0021CC309A|nr:uncharacterized protein LOC127043040 isoform X2 [Gopherus flavomarginatus]